MILTAPVFIKPGILTRCPLSRFSPTHFFYTIHIEPHDVRVCACVLVQKLSLVRISTFIMLASVFLAVPVASSVEPDALIMTPSEISKGH